MKKYVLREFTLSTHTIQRVARSLTVYDARLTNEVEMRSVFAIFDLDRKTLGSGRLGV